MNIYLEVLKKCSTFNCAIIKAYLDKDSPSQDGPPIFLSPEIISKLNSFKEIPNITPKQLEAKLKSTFCPSPDRKSVFFREKKLINNFWNELTPPNLAGCTVKIGPGKSVKTYHRGGEVIAASFGGFENGQFGEFNHPLLSADTIKSIGVDVDKKGLKFLVEEFKDCNFEVPNSVIHHDGYSETFPLGLYGIKSIPITVAETDELQANNGTFSSETIANHHYQRLSLEGCAFTPLFSPGTKVPFDKKVFRGDNLSILNRLQKTLKRIQKDAKIIDSNENLWISGNVVNKEVIDASIFSDKIGMFTTTWVGYSIKEPPILKTLEELLLLTIDSFWIMEQSILNKIYITDLNIGNILHYNMAPWVHLAGWDVIEGNLAREYSWEGGEIKIPNNFTRLVFIDLGMSRIENPSLGNRRIIDKISPLSKNSRCDIIADCRNDLLAVIQYLAVVNNLEGNEAVSNIHNLNVNKNLFFQILDLEPIKALIDSAKTYEVAEKYHSKVFR